MKGSRITFGLALAVLTAALTLPVAADPGGVGSARLQLVEATIQNLQKALQNAPDKEEYQDLLPLVAASDAQVLKHFTLLQKMAQRPAPTAPHPRRAACPRNSIERPSSSRRRSAP